MIIPDMKGEEPSYTWLLSLLGMMILAIVSYPLFRAYKSAQNVNWADTGRRIHHIIKEIAPYVGIAASVYAVLKSSGLLQAFGHNRK